MKLSSAGNKEKSEAQHYVTSSNMRIAGIIGGLGPHTSSMFYLEIIKLLKEKGERCRPPLLMWNVPLDLRIEQSFIKYGFGKELYLSYLVEGANHLIKGGSDFLAIPCNTVHIHIDKLKESFPVPILSIMDETINYIKYKNISRIAVLATSETINSKLYTSKLEKEGIEYILPDETVQEKITDIIRKVVSNTDAKRDKDELAQIIKGFNLKGGVNDVLLACTDLQLLVNKSECPVSIHDTMEILARAVVRECLKPKFVDKVADGRFSSNKNSFQATSKCDNRKKPGISIMSIENISIERQKFKNEVPKLHKQIRKIGRKIPIAKLLTITVTSAFALLLGDFLHKRN